MTRRRSARRGAGGVALFAAVAFVALATLTGWPLGPAGGAAAWLGGLLLWSDAPRRTRGQAVILMGIGAAASALAARLQTGPSLAQAFAGNTALIAMLAAVSFLRLITTPVAGSAETGPRPRGVPALVRTLFGLHVFGSVVNLSTVFIMAARMAGDSQRLDRRQLQVLTRGFATAAFWSPFFAAMAAALTFVPGARLAPLVGVGLIMAAVALVLAAVTLSRGPPADAFRGYPMNWRSLRLPAGLGVIVVTVHLIDPTVSILGLIALTAPVLALAAMLRRGEAAGRRFARHVVSRLPGMVNELWLFLSAGIMAAGLAALMRALPPWLPFREFAGPQAAGVLVAMVGLSLVGVHPVIGMAVFAALLAPLAPDPTLLAMTFLAAWALGTMMSPFGGINMALQGAYGLPPGEVLRANGGYGLALMAIAALVINGYALLTR